MTAGVRPPWQPDLSRLATLMRARLQVQGDVGATFTATSEPTLADAQTAMDMVCAEMAVGLPDATPERYYDALAACASYGAAAILEPAGQPEQTRSDQSPRPTWALMHDACVPRVTGLVLADVGDGNPGDGPAGEALPLGQFPCGAFVSGEPW